MLRNLLSKITLANNWSSGKMRNERLCGLSIKTIDTVFYEKTVDTVLSRKDGRYRGFVAAGSNSIELQ